MGVGLHPWGRWNRNFVEYGVTAARAAIADAGVSVKNIQFLAAAGTVRSGYPGHVAAATLSRALGLDGVEAVTVYGACASGMHALAVARDRILAGECDVALVVGSDVARAEGAMDAPVDAPSAGAAQVAGIPYAVWLGLRARRRMHEHGTRCEDLHQVRVKNSAHGALNANARFRMRLSSREVASSPVVASPLHLLHVSTFSDGAAAIVIASEKFARKSSCHRVRVRSLSLSNVPDEGVEMPCLTTRLPDPAAACGRSANVARTLRCAGLAPEELSVIELYDVSSVSELEWYERIGLCGSGDAEDLLRSGATALGGRIPVNVSGGLGSFGEAVAAQALAQVCELTWQIQGRAGSRQVAGAATGLAVADGMYGHVASVALSA
jgi:acetyl-CoA acetyltransferase